MPEGSSEAPASPQKAVQICVHCKKPFVLVAGAREDASIVVPSSKDAKPIKMTYGEAVLRHQAIVDHEAIADSELDPVTGRISVGKRAVPFHDIVTIGLYRRVDWVTLIVLVLLYFVPVCVPLLIASFSIPLLFLLSLPPS